MYPSLDEVKQAVKDILDGYDENQYRCDAAFSGDGTGTITIEIFVFDPVTYNNVDSVQNEIADKISAEFDTIYLTSNSFKIVINQSFDSSFLVQNYN